MKNIYILIPAFNPNEKLKILINELRKQVSIENILIINDGSTNGFDFSTLQVKVISHNTNFGKGEALKNGLNYLINNYKNCKGIVTADCDLQHLPEDIIKICNCLKNNPEKLILGSRFTHKNKIPLKSRVGNNVISFIMKHLYKISLIDTQTGLRGIPANFVKEILNINNSDFSFETVMLLLAVKNNIHIEEVEINTIYYDNNSSTHFKPIKDSYKIMKNLIRGIK